jgi:hypothetical protein
MALFVWLDEERFRQFWEWMKRMFLFELHQTLTQFLNNQQAQGEQLKLLSLIISIYFNWRTNQRAWSGRRQHEHTRGRVCNVRLPPGVIWGMLSAAALLKAAVIGDEVSWVCWSGFACLFWILTEQWNCWKGHSWFCFMSLNAGLLASMQYSLYAEDPMTSHSNMDCPGFTMSSNNWWEGSRIQGHLVHTSIAHTSTVVRMSSLVMEAIQLGLPSCPKRLVCHRVIFWEHEDPGCSLP